MSKWCGKCRREPYHGCDSNCPVFGCDFEALAEKCLELSDACSSGTKDEYKVQVLTEMLNGITQDEYYLCRLKGDDTKNINLDAKAIELLIKYYST